MMIILEDRCNREGFVLSNRYCCCEMQKEKPEGLVRVQDQAVTRQDLERSGVCMWLRAFILIQSRVCCMTDQLADNSLLQT